MQSSYGICTTGNQRKTEKIDLYFEDQIKKTKNIKITLFSWTRIDQLKKKLAKEKYGNGLAWKDIRLFYKNIQLTPDNRRFFDFGVEPDSIIFIKSIESDKRIEKGIINPYQIFDIVPPEIEDLIIKVQSGLNNGKKPRLAEEGTSGTYFLENHQKKKVAIFKPFNQEPYAENNPRNMVGRTGGQGIRKGILSGESATRQVAAYLLDQNHFHSVPNTTYIQFFHPTFLNKDDVKNPITSQKQTIINEQHRLKTKHGSLQQFMESNDIVGNMGSNQFDKEQVHKIGILDVRILNCDRNQANILVKKKTVVSGGKQRRVCKLIPIDHGLSFPDNFEIYDYEIVWMGYRQASEPFSDKSLKFIQSINPIEDCKRLREKLGFREKCLRNFRIAETFLKKMAKAGFTLAQIGDMMYRKDDEEYLSEEQQKQNKNNDQDKSTLEKLVNQAESLYYLVKENGIKSTVNLQLRQLQLKKNQEAPPFTQFTEGIKKEKSQDFDKSEKVQKDSEEKKSKKVSIEKDSTKNSPGKIRNVSLPNLKVEKKTSKTDAEKKKKKRKIGNNKNHSMSRRQQEWDEVFFHYFEGILDRYIEERNKNNRVTTRPRLMSEDINYEY